MPTPAKTTRTRRSAPPDTPPPNGDDIITGEDWRQQIGSPAGALIVHDEDEPPDEPLTAADRVAAMLADVAGDARAKVKLYRLGSDGKMVWCDDMTPEQFETGGLPSIRNRWGAGDYVLALYGTTPGKAGSPNGFGLITRQTVSIAPDLTAPADAPAAHSGLSQVLATIAEGQRAMLEALTRRPETQADPLQQMGVMLGLMTQMRQAMGGDGPREKPRGVVELLTELKALKDLGGELLGGEKAEPSDPLTAALPEVLSLIKTATAQQAAPGAAPALPMPAVQLPPSIPETTPENPTVPEITDPQQLIAQLQKHLRNLVKLAAANVDHELGADIVYDNLPDELIEAMRGEAWFDMLSSFEPGVTPHREWFDKVRALVLEWFANGHPDDADDAPADGAPA